MRLTSTFIRTWKPLLLSIRIVWTSEGTFYPSKPAPVSSFWINLLRTTRSSHSSSRLPQLRNLSSLLSPPSSPSSRTVDLPQETRRQGGLPGDSWARHSVVAPRSETATMRRARKRVSKRKGLRKAMDMRKERTKWMIMKMNRSVSSVSRLRIWPRTLQADQRLTSKPMSVHLLILMRG